jgi:dolichol-phosphate mannosyltransferase
LIVLSRPVAPTAERARKHVVVVSPVYNERESVGELLAAIDAAMAELPYRYTMVLVDDGSDEETAALLDREARGVPHRNVIHLARNFGHQAALTAGLDEARRLGADAAICLDSDLQHPPRLIPEFLAQWEAGYEVVYGIRDEGSSPGFLKRLTSWWFYALIRLLASDAAPRGTADFRLLAKPALIALTDLRERTRFLRGMTVWIGFRQVAIHYVPSPRFGGTSKYTFSKMLRLALHGLVSTSTRPLYLALSLGAFVSVAALLYAVWVAIDHFLWHDAVPGWTSVMVAVMGLGAMNLLLLGVMGVYLARVLDEVRGRPIYVVRSRPTGPQDGA